MTNSHSGCNLYDFAKNYFTIKDRNGNRHFNNYELAEIKQMQKMINDGYELKLLRLRKGSKMGWYKKDNLKK